MSLLIQILAQQAVREHLRAQAERHIPSNDKPALRPPDKNLQTTI